MGTPVLVLVAACPEALLTKIALSILKWRTDTATPDDGDPGSSTPEDGVPASCDGLLADTSWLTSPSWLLVRALLTSRLKSAAAAGSAVSDGDAYVPLRSDGADPGTATRDDGDLGSATPVEGAPAPSKERFTPTLVGVAGSPIAHFCCHGHVG